MKAFPRKHALRAGIALASMILFHGSCPATTAILLTDDQLIASSRVIVLGDVRSINAQWDSEHQDIHSYVKVHVSKLLKGELQRDDIVFKQLGGTVGDESSVVFGSPDFKVGQRVLLFLDTRVDGTLRIAQLFMGKYDVIDEPSGKTRVERNVDSASVNVLGRQDGGDITNKATLSKFTRKIKRVLRDQTAEAAEYDAKYHGVPIVEIPPEYFDEPGEVSPAYTFLGTGYRWFEPDTNQAVPYRVNSTGAPIAGGGVTEINQALTAWTNVATSSLILQNAGVTTQVGFRSDGVSAVSFNDPLDQMQDPVGCSGVLAIGGVTRTGSLSRTIGGQTFRQIAEGDVVFNRNMECFLGVSANLAEVATHEFGHTIGFGHSTYGSAIMYAYAHGGGRGATLAADDIAAATFLYPDSAGAPPTRPNPPSGLMATAASSSQVNLAWTDNSNDENGFKVERKTGVNGAYVQLAVLAANATSYSDAGLAPSSTYYYRVRAYNAVGDSDYSSEVSATTLPAAVVPNDSAFVSQTVPSAMIAGHTYTVSVTFRNTGTQTWSGGSGYKLASQNPFNNSTWGTTRVVLPPGSRPVVPGGQITFSFVVKAPLTSGTYNFQWSMWRQSFGPFGQLSPNVSVSVTP